MGYFITNKKKIKLILALSLVFFVLMSSVFFFEKNLVNNEDKHEFLAAYSIYINDKFVIKVTNLDSLSSDISLAKSQIEEELSYTPDYNYNLKIVPSTYVGEELDLIPALKTAIRNNISLKSKGYLLKVGDLTLSFLNKSDLLYVLTKAQNRYIEDQNSITVSLEKDEHNPLVIIPKSTILSRDLPKERIFVSNAMLSEPNKDINEANKEYFDAVLTDVKLDKSIVITESYVNDDDIVDPDLALEYITKENEKKKSYKVVKGDIPETIAIKNDMTVDKLYDLNDNLRENATRIQIGQELIVMVPEPEITVSTEEKVIYTKRIEHENDYINSPNEYVGTYTVVNEGRDGLVEVRAKVKKVNGKVVSQEIFEETTILEPIRGTCTKGSKRLPITTATGVFECPMINYYITSPFGYRWGRLHRGLDFAGAYGSPILASDGGRVIKAGWDGSYGYSVEIDHGNGYITKYAHCSDLYVEVGQDVAQYETIAALGNSGNSTGPHLHFEIREWGMPRDPMSYLRIN